LLALLTLPTSGARVPREPSEPIVRRENVAHRRLVPRALAPTLRAPPPRLPPPAQAHFFFFFFFLVFFGPSFCFFWFSLGDPNRQINKKNQKKLLKILKLILVLKTPLGPVAP
jgi:hypothetical protein